MNYEEARRFAEGALKNTVLDKEEILDYIAKRMTEYDQIVHRNMRESLDRIAFYLFLMMKIGGGSK